MLSDNGKMWKKVLLVCVVTLIFKLGAEAVCSIDDFPSHVEYQNFPDLLVADINNLIIERMNLYHTPGAIVGIVKGNDLIYKGCFGWADVEERRSVNEETLFRIGSISKTMTAVGLMQQWEKGKFKLDDDINEYLPKRLIVPPHPNARPVTFRHLLTHLSGGGEFLSYKQVLKAGFGVMVKGDDYQPLSYYLRLGMRTPLDPGKLWAYCNYGFGFLGLALEQMSGEEFHLYMKRHVFDVLGMKNSTFRHHKEMWNKVAKGYRFKKGMFIEDEPKVTGITPAGNVFTDINDMSKYVIALLNGGANSHGVMLKSETLALMMKTHYTLDERQLGMGLVFFIYSNNYVGRRIVGHSGSIPFGFTSQMLLVPSEKIGVFVFTNCWDTKPSEIAWGVLRLVMGGSNDKPREISVDENILREIEGVYGVKYKYFKLNARVYMSGIGAFQVKRSATGLKLIYLWQGKSKAKTIVPADENDPYFFRVISNEELPSYVTFVKDSKGDVKSMIVGLNEYVKLSSFRKADAYLLSVPGKMMVRFLPF